MTSTTALILAIFAAAVSARAELPRQSRDEATHVVTGTVTKVFQRDGRMREFLIEIFIDGVEKGDDLEDGDFVYAFAFQRKSRTSSEPGIGGHRAVPKEGQRIKAWLKRSKGRVTALYPEWFDLLTDPGKTDESR